MDINTTNAGPLSGSPLAQGRSNPLRTLLDALQTKIGQVLDAKVVSSRSIKPEELALLLTAKKQDNRLNIATRQNLLALLSTPKPALLKIDVKGQTVPVLHHRLITPGQTLPVSVRSDGQLQLLQPAPALRQQPAATHQQFSATHPSVAHTKADLATQKTEAAPLPSTNQQPSAPDKRLQLQTDRPVLEPKGHRPSTAGQTAQLKPTPELLQFSSAQLHRVKTEITDAVRRVLPLAKPLATALTQFTQSTASPNLLQLLTQKPELASNMNALLQPLAASLKSPNQPLFTAQELRAAIQHQALPIEHKLQQLLNHAPSEGPKVSTTDDLKTQLLQLTNSLQPQTASDVRVQPDQVRTAVEKLLSLLFGKPNAASLASHQAQQPGAPSESVSRALELFTATSLARLQLNQYRSINTLLGTLAENSGPPTLFTDLTFRLGDVWTTVHLQFQDLNRKKEDKDPKKKPKEAKQRWRVFMEMQLDDDAMLAVEVTQQEKNIGAMFWSNSEQVRSQTREQFDQLKTALEKQGLSVSDLRCSNQNPPAQDIKLDYALIDVKT